MKPFKRRLRVRVYHDIMLRQRISAAKNTTAIIAVKRTRLQLNGSTNILPCQYPFSNPKTKSAEGDPLHALKGRLCFGLAFANASYRYA